MTILPSSYHGFFFFFLLTTASLFFVSSAQPNPRNTDPYAYSKFSPSMAVIIVILIAALFFMAFFSIYIRHCATNSTSSSVRLRAAERHAAAAARGLDPSVIDTFPTLVYSMVKDLKIGKSALECAVCLCEFEDDETLRLIPKCDHVFHPDCIDTWLASHTTCPVCRANLVPQPGDENHHENLPSQLRGLDPESQEQQSGEVDQQQQQQEERQRGEEVVQEEPMSQPRVLDLSMRLNRNRTRGSRSGRPRKFPRSHSTGHSLVQPGENTDRFTLRLPDEVRKQIVNRKLNRATSLVLLPSEGSSRRGYRTGSSRGKYYRRLEELEPEIKSDRWGFSKVGPFLSRMSSSVRSLSRSLSIRSVKGTGKAGEGSSVQAGEPEGSNFGSARLPV